MSDQNLHSETIESAQYPNSFELDQIEQDAIDHLMSQNQELINSIVLLKGGLSNAMAYINQIAYMAANQKQSSDYFIRMLMESISLANAKKQKALNDTIIPPNAISIYPNRPSTPIVFY